jgi:putative transferase (TIGR04331 family)
MLKSKMIYLSGTSLLPEARLDGKVVFLVNSVVERARKMRPDLTDFDVMPGLWIDRRELVEASDYLDNMYERLGVKLGFFLSRIHNVAYPPIFWQIPLGTWLVHYLQAMYDRYSRLKAAVEIYGGKHLTVLEHRYGSHPPAGFAELMEKMSVDEQAVSFFYGTIAREIGLPVYHFETGQIDTAVRKKSAWQHFQARSMFRSRLSRWVHSNFFMGNSVLMSPYVFNWQDKRVFSRKIDAAFFPMGNTKTEQKPIQRATLREIAADDEFENLAVRLLPIFMPTYLLEDFDSYHKNARQWIDYKVYFSADEWHGNIPLAYAASLGRLKGAKIVGCQHGGGYGQFERTPLEFVERGFCDYYITWGWTDNLYKGANLIPLPQPNLSKIKKRSGSKMRANILWAGTLMHRQLMRFTNKVPDKMHIFHKDITVFLEGLDRKVRAALVYRPHTVNSLWRGDEQDLFKGYPEVRIENSRPFNEVLAEARMFICDHQSTSFMEALVADTPTILFWNSALIDERPSVSESFDALRDAGILFHDPIEAACQVNAVWDSVEEWWQQPIRQKARCEFVNKFCLAAPDWQEHWIKQFDTIMAAS